MMCSNDINRILLNNLNSKKHNIIKFYAWLENNENIPFFIKIKVLYTCLFSSLLYSAEAWGELTQINNDILKIEKRSPKEMSWREKWYNKRSYSCRA